MATANMRIFFLLLSRPGSRTASSGAPGKIRSLIIQYITILRVIIRQVPDWMTNAERPFFSRKAGKPTFHVPLYEPKRKRAVCQGAESQMLRDDSVSSSEQMNPFDIPFSAVHSVLMRY